MVKFSLTPKNIILHAVSTKLEANGIDKLILNFNILEDRYSVFLSAHDKNSKLELDDSDVNTIKKVFINKIGKVYKDKYDIDVKSVIIEIDVKKQKFDVFVENPDGKVTTFDY
jgi:hypothetical protein